MPSHALRGAAPYAAWGLLATYWAILVWQTHSPAPLGPGPIVPHLDKALHFVAFALLGAGLTTARSMRLSRVATIGPARRRRLAIVNWCTISAFAILDEATQPMTGRTCDVFDWIADAAGAALGIWGATRLWSRIARESAPS